MLENIKSLITLKTAEKNIRESNYDLALQKLNELIEKGYRLDEVYLKRGELCHKLLMLDEAYSDYTYVIMHYKNNEKAFAKRVKLDFDMTNYREAVHDADELLILNSDNFEYKYLKLLSLVFMSDFDNAKSFVFEMFNSDKYKILQFLFTETAKFAAENELAKGLKILELIETIDPINPLKILKESQIYAQAGETQKSEIIFRSIDSAFPKYFVSHFRFTDMYEERDLLETCFLIELQIFDKNASFAYPIEILKGYKNYMEGHIIDSKECFENAIKINPNKPEAYVLLAETLQLMSGYNNPEFMNKAEENYNIAMQLYERENLTGKADKMRKQIKHLNSTISIGR